MRILGISGIRFPRVPIPRLFPSPRRSAVAVNVESILRVPRAQLPDGPARRFLISEAMDGQDVRAYQPIGSDVWNIWYGPLAPRYDARIPAATWATFFETDLAAKVEAAHAAHRAATRGITQANGRAEGGAR